MKSFLLLFLFLLGSIQDSQPLPEKYYFLLPDKEIIPDTTSTAPQAQYMVAEGENLVFHFRRQTKKFDQTIAYDAGIREDFYFQVPKGEEEFELRDDEISKAMAYSQTFCRCIPRWVYFTKGTITGKKTGENEWKVSIDIHGKSPTEEDQTFSIQTTGTFRPE